MIKSENINSLVLAYNELMNAGNEMCRPQEDVVTFSACHSVRNSLRQMMHYYLLANNVTSAPDASLNDLFDLCKVSNPAFTGIDLSSIECKGLAHSQCDSKYCLSVDNVGNCLNAATDMKNVIWRELNIA